jgi:hypothetical protein
MNLRQAPPGAKPVRPKFSECDQVVKPQGYPFPGEIRAVFRTKAGKWRYVVEATGDGYAGMLHIFDGDRLELADKGTM